MNYPVDPRLEDIDREQSQLETIRSTFDSHWQEIARRIYPAAADFQGDQPEGAKNTQYIFDSTASLALERFASAVNGYVTPSNQQWHGLETDNADLNKEQDVKEWCEAATHVLFAVRYSDLSNFEAQINEVYMSLGAFGTGCMFVDEVIAKAIRYKSIHLSEIYFSENGDGRIDRTNRKFKMSARNIAEKFGDKAELPETVLQAAEKKPHDMLEVLHVVRPNDNKKHGSYGHNGMNFESLYMLRKEKCVLEEGGYNTFPYAISRYVTQARETYGRSPAMTVLPDVKMLNEMNKSTIRQMQLAVEPPVLLQEDGALQGFKMKPGALNYGGVDDQGRPLAHAFQTGARFDMAFEMQAQKRKQIETAFLIYLFQILVESPQMTAYEVMQRMQEKGQLLGPTMGRQRSETQSIVIQRELDILEKAGALPPKPEKMLRAGARVRISASGPMARAQRAEEGVGILRTIEAVTPLAQIDQEVLLTFKPTKIARTLAEINGMPMDCLNSEDEVKAMKDEKQQANQAQQLIEAAPLAGKAAKDLATAQAVSTNSSGQQFPSLTIQ